MNILPLSLNDLNPTEAVFTLSTMPGTPLTLRPWSLYVRAWAQNKYTNAGLQTIFSKQMMVEIAEIAFFLLRDKSPFKDENDFLDKVLTIQDQINLIKAVLQTVGIGEPEIEKISQSLPKKGEDVDPKTPSPGPKKSKTGAKSSTP